MANDKLQLTSVKVVKEEFDAFKTGCVRTKFNLQRLVQNTMELYNGEGNEDYRKLIENPELSGSYSL